MKKITKKIKKSIANMAMKAAGVEAKQHTVSPQILLSIFFVLLFLTRFLPFYEITGIRKENGLGAIMYYKIIFIICFFLFLTGILVNIKNVIKILLQTIPLTAMVIFEIIYMFSKDYNLKCIQYGLGINIVFSIFMVCYCIYVGNRKSRNI